MKNNFVIVKSSLSQLQDYAIEKFLFLFKNFKVSFYMTKHNPYKICRVLSGPLDSNISVILCKKITLKFFQNENLFLIAYSCS